MKNFFQNKITNLSVKQLFFFIIIINFILKFPLLFVDVMPSDVYFYFASGNLLQNGILPYRDFFLMTMNYDLYLNHVHPNGPLNYIFYSFFVMLLGNSPFSIKLPMFISEVLIAIYIFKIGLLFYNKKYSFLFSLLYTICIPSYFTGIMVGCDELVTSAFSVAGIYYFLRSKYYLSGCLIGLGISYKLFPIFLLPPLFIYCRRNGLFSGFFKLIISLSFTFIVVSLPYLVLDAQSFLVYNFGQSNRFITISLGKYFRDTFLYQPLFEVPILFIKITPLLIMQLSVVSGIFFWEYHNYILKRNEFNATHLFNSIAIYLIILPLISLSYNYRYFQWLLPFMILGFSNIFVQDISTTNFNSKKNTLHKKWIIVVKRFIIIILISLILISIIIVIYFYQQNSGMIDKVPFGISNYNNYLNTFLYSYFAFFIFITIYLWQIKRIRYWNIISLIHGITGLYTYYFHEMNVFTLTDFWRRMLTINYILFFLAILTSLIFVIYNKNQNNFSHELGKKV